VILPKLHVTTDDRIVSQEGFLQAASRVVRSGALALHLRAPNLAGGRWIQVARQIREAVEDTRSLLFVNDRVDVALAVAAHGVHLPEQGIPLEAARRLLPTRIFLGCSVHSPEDARAAFSRGADYVFLGPIFQTASHPDRQPLGLEVIERSLPGRVIAIGGITAERAAQCIRAGAYGVAVIGAVWEAEHPAAAAEAILLSLELADHD
jgi:thiamine-phosphate pyrophosphorylase